MALSYRRALSANALSSFLGLGTQALTPPLFMWVLPVQEFSRWIFVAAISSYLSLAMNGLFYAVMNDLVIAMHRGDREKGTRLYSCGIAFIVGQTALVALGTLVIFLCAPPGGFARIAMVGSLTYVINLTAVMFDANFRAMNRYEFGTNILTSVRTLDWATGFIIIALTRNVDLTLEILLLVKIVTVAAFFVVFKRSPDALKPVTASVTLHDLISILKSARGQIILSAAMAAAAMGPQIVVSSIFNSLQAVTFNTYRTYLRLTAAFVTMTTYASWPMLNKMYAEGRIREMDIFFPRLLTLSMIGALVCGAGLIALATPLFPVLFHNKVPVHLPVMGTIFLSVLINCAITVFQGLYLATNLPSRQVTFSFSISLMTLIAMVGVGKVFGLVPMLIVQIIGDIATLAVIAYAFRKTMSDIRITTSEAQPQPIN